MGSKNHVLDGDPDSPCEGGNFDGKSGGPYELPAVSSAKMAEPIDMQFGMLSPVGPGNHF